MRTILKSMKGKFFLSLTLAAIMAAGTLFAGAAQAYAEIGNVTTNAATAITSTDATLNGANGSTPASGHSFWVSLSPFSTASPTVPSGVYSTQDFGAITANTPFSASLSSVTTTGYPSNLPAITPNTTYYFVAWSNVGGTWYPGSVLSFTTSSTSPCSAAGTFNNFALGSVNGQNGWSATGPYDEAVVNNTYGYSTFGCKTFRISDATTSGSFGDWVFEAPLANSVGETAATAGGYPVGTKYNHFETQFDIASTMPNAQQPGLHISVSPDRGDGSRMSYLRFEDQADGIHVFFDDVTDPSHVVNADTFNETDIATLNRAVPHTVKLTFDAIDGSSNDVVNVYIDGVLKHTGTSWEDYYRYDSEASVEQSPRIIKTIIIQSRTGSGPLLNPADQGHGFLFDNFSLTASDTQPPVIAPHADVTVPATALGSATVNYSLPIATDNVDGTDAVTCLQATGSVFPIGTTTVTCNSHDAANNNATSTTFHIIVTPGPVDPTQSTVTTAAGTITTDGGVPGQITVTVKDQYGNPIPGIPASSIVLSADGSGNTLTQPSNPTDGNGQTKGLLSSTVAGVKNITVTVDGVPLANGATMTFGTGAFDHVTVTPTGSQSVVYGNTLGFSAQGFDANNNPISGLTYTWTANNGTGSGSVSPLFGNGSTFTAKGVGTVTVTATGFSLSSGSKSGSSGTITVTARPISVKADAKTKVYGATDPALTYQITSGNLIGSDSFTGTLTRDPGENVGNYAITQGALTLGNNYTIGYTPDNLTITPATATVTVTASNKVYDGTTAATVNLSVSGAVGEDTLTAASTSATFSDKNVGNGKTVTVSGITLIGAPSSNDYTFNHTATADANITPLAITVTAAANTKVYDGTTTAAAIPTVTALVSGDTPNFIEAYSNKNVGTGKTLIPSGTVSDDNSGNNYAVTFDSVTTGVITPLTLTVTATGVDKVYDGTTNATVTLSDNHLSGDTVTDSYTSASFADPNVGTTKPVSVSGISISGADAGNYTFNTTASTSANINQLAASVTPDAKTKVYGATDPTLTGTLTGFLAADNVTATYSRIPGESVAGSPYTISATLSPSGVLANYNVTYHTAPFTITAESVTVTATASDKVYDGTAAATASLTVHGAVSPDVLTASYTSAVFDTKNVGTGKMVTISGITLSGTNAANYSFNNTATATAKVTPLPITVTAVTDTKVYDRTTSSVGVPTITSGALAAGDSVTWTQTFDTKNVGSGKTLSPAGTVSDTNGGANYLVTFVPVTTGTITQLPLTVTATGVNKAYDGTTNATVTLTDNRISGDVFTDSYTGAVFASPSVGTAIPVAVSGISISGTDAGNYSFNTTAATAANITPLAITVTANAQTKVYGTSDPAIFTYTFSPNPISPDVFSGALSRASGETVGSYAITQGSLALTSNYTINFVSASLTITKATPVITWTNPADVVAGTVLGGTQLDATTPVAGTFAYTPAAGTQLTTATSHSLSAVFTPTDTTDYNSANASVTMNVYPAPISQLVVAASPTSTSTLGSSLITVTGEDQYGNVTSNQSGTQVVVGADNGGALGQTLLTLASGTANTTLTDSSAGTVHVTVSSGSLTAANVTVTFTPVDSNPPSVTTTIPDSSVATGGVAITAPLFINFNKALLSTSVTSANIQLKQQASTTTTSLDVPVPATLSLVTGDTQVEIQPTSPLLNGTSYYFVVNGVVSSFGIPMTSAFSSLANPFTTAASTPLPTVPTQYPTAGAIGVALNVQPFVNFSEAMDVTTLTSTNVYLVADSAPTVAVPATVVTANGGTRAIIEPTSPLSANTPYHVIVTTGVANTVGGALAPQYVGGSFTTLVPVLPTVSSQTPTVGATSVPVSVQPTVTFSEAVDATTLTSANVQLFASGTTTPISATVVAANGATQAVLEPLTPLMNGTTYYIQVNTGVADASGNHLAATYGSAAASQFTTSADNTVLSVTGSSLLQSFATPDNTFAHGWKWQLSVTAPTAETQMQMKFTDFVGSGTSTIPALTNIQFYSPQSSDHSTEGTAVVFQNPLDAGGFSLPLADLGTDLDPSTPGRQFQIIVEARVPVGTPGGSYSNSYDIQTTAH